MNEDGGVYIHIPFCASKCAYCDFLSFETEVRRGGKWPHVIQEQYVQALLAEIRQHDFLDAIIDTVYIGGGTPTTLPSPLLCEVLRQIQGLNLATDAEITLEMNPCTDVALSEYKAHGVNRLSIGLQAWQWDLLEKIKRSHTAESFPQIINDARVARFDNINIDLMFALPGQTMRNWRESISQVIELNPEHISTYSLTPAEGTPLWDWIEAGEITLPDEALDRAMYHEAISMLTAAGYKHYEISNFAKPGRESRHNVGCWRRKHYKGFGLGAHSFDGVCRWRNTRNMEWYINGYGLRKDIDVLTEGDAMAETMFLGLRMAIGVSKQEFYDAFGTTIAYIYGPKINKLIGKGLIVDTGDRIALTPRGLDFANQVFEVFL